MAGEEGLLGAAPADAQAAAVAKIDELNADPTFREAYDSRWHPGHEKATQQMETLASQAWPGEVEIDGIDYDAGRSPEEVEAQQPGIPKTEEEWQADDAAELERVGQELQERLGHDWQPRVAAAREGLEAALGPEAVQAIVGELGNDPDVITEIVALAEADPSKMLPAMIADYRGRGIYFDRARLELENLRADPEWRRARESRGREVDVANAREVALLLLADPPKKILRALEPLIR